MGQKVVIIGNGISGVTTARYLRKTDRETEILIISSETKHFFSRTALMYIYMGHMKYENTKPYEDWFWTKNRIDLLQDRVTEVDFEKKSICLQNNSPIGYDKLVLALGSKPNKFGWPGENLKGVQGLYSYQDLETLEHNTRDAKTAVIVGGGLIGVELAEMLRSRDIEVHFLVREKFFWNSVLPNEEAKLISEHIINDHHVHIHFESNLERINDNGKGWVKSVVIKETGEEIACDLVGLTAGVRPNIELLKNTDLEIDKGILISPFMETNLKDVYALGDCAQHREVPFQRRPVEQVWYTGRMMGETLGKTLGGNPTKYQPGPWFNSAKFFDIEYQTYGQVASKIQENEARFYWQHPKENLALHLVFDKNTGAFIGLNCFGIRLRHELLDKYLREEKSIDFVLEYFNDLNFDPEFYKNHFPSIIEKFNKQFGKSIKLKKKSWKRIFQLN